MTKDEVMAKLFTAKWNIPQAARELGLTDDECKAAFTEFCQTNPPIYVLPDQGKIPAQEDKG